MNKFNTSTGTFNQAARKLNSRYVLSVHGIRGNISVYKRTVLDKISLPEFPSKSIHMQLCVET